MPLIRTRRARVSPASSAPGAAPRGASPAGRATPSVPSVPPATVLRARRRLLGLYGLLGLTLSSWLARLPTVRTELDLSTGELGTILLLGAVGSLLTVLAAGAITVRWGSVTTMVAAALVFSVANLLLGVGPALGSVLVLVAGVVLLSASFALGNVPMNVETVVIERAMGRTIVPQFHAAFSVGTVVGSGIGAAAAWGSVPLLVQFAVISVISLVWRLRVIPGSVLSVPDARTTPGAVPARPAPVERVRRRGVAARQALGAWRERRTLVIGVVVLVAALSEGSANNWLAIGVVDGFGQSEAVAAVVFGVFVTSMTVARLLGTRLIDRYGRATVLAASGVVALVGLGLFGLGPSLPLAVVGVVCWGLGGGLIVPIGIAAVSSDPMRAAGRVAVVSAFASVASLGAPPLIGVVAEHVGVRHALLLICAAMVVGVLLAREAGAPVAVPTETEPLALEARVIASPTTAPDAVPTTTEPVAPPAPAVPACGFAAWHRPAPHLARRATRTLVGAVRR